MMGLSLIQKVILTQDGIRPHSPLSQHVMDILITM